MASQKIIFSPHASIRMEERSISRVIVIKAIKNPDKVERSSLNPSRFLVKKLYFNQRLRREHLLMIICEGKPNYIEVITIIDTSKISKYF